MLRDYGQCFETAQITNLWSGWYTPSMTGAHYSNHILNLSTMTPLHDNLLILLPQIIRSPMKSYVIDTVVDPRTQKFISAGEAIKMGIIDPSTATYHNIVTGESITFEEAIRVCTELATLNLTPHFCERSL